MRNASLAVAFCVALVVGCAPVRGPAPRAEDAVAPARPDAADAGLVTYRLMDGHVFRLAARRGARAEDVSEALDRRSPRAHDEWLNSSPDGRWLLTSTERFGCSGWACLARIDGSVAHAEPLTAGGRPLHGEFGAIAPSGALVIYQAGDGPHVRDLWVTRQEHGVWTVPTPITRASPYAYNSQPAISPDGRRVLFDCNSTGTGQQTGGSICSVATSGGRVTTVVRPSDGPGGTDLNEVHHPAFGPRGTIVFEGDWGGERIWRLPHGSSRPQLVSRVSNDNSPCVLPDGRIVSLWLNRPGNPSGVHEIRVADAHGAHAAMLLTGHDVLDIGTGCG